MKWGLLAGAGRGLSQGASMLNQGMAEDRAVKRAEELERMREASIERRWKMDVARQDQIRKEDLSYRVKRDGESDSQFNRNMSLREKQVIEQNLMGVMEQEARSADRIRQSYQKRLSDGMGDPSVIQAEMDAELKAEQMLYSRRLHSMIQSYGPQGLKGTGFEYLLSVTADGKLKDDVKDDEPGGDPTPGNKPRPIIDLDLPDNKPKLPGANYKVDESGAPELTFGNLFKKWSQNTRPGLLTPEAMEQQNAFRQDVRSQGIQSAYGATALQKQGR